MLWIFWGKKWSQEASRTNAKALGQKLVRALGGRRIEKDPAIGGVWNVELVSAFIDAAGDPEGDLVAWLRTGCPAGVAKEITSCGIFPATEPDDVSQLESWRLVDEEPSSNYKSVDEAVELSGAEVDKLIEKGYAVKYESWQDVIDATGEVLVSRGRHPESPQCAGSAPEWLQRWGSTEGTHRTAEGERSGPRCLRTEALRGEQ